MNLIKTKVQKETVLYLSSLTLMFIQKKKRTIAAQVVGQRIGVIIKIMVIISYTSNFTVKLSITYTIYKHETILFLTKLT